MSPYYFSNMVFRLQNCKIFFWGQLLILVFSWKLAFERLATTNLISPVIEIKYHGKCLLMTTARKFESVTVWTLYSRWSMYLRTEALWRRLKFATTCVDSLPDFATFTLSVWFTETWSLATCCWTKPWNSRSPTSDWLLASSTRARRKCSCSLSLQLFVIYSEK